MSSRLYIAFLIVNILGEVLALVELPQVEKNNILETDISIRETTNKLFAILKLKANERSTLKEYSVIHNYLVSNSLHDYTNLREIAKLTRVDKTKLNNQIQNFMAILNEILDENIEVETETEDEYVIRHIEGFLKNLDKYTDTYKYDKYNVNIIIKEILSLIQKNDTFSEVYNSSIYTQNNLLESSEEKDILINENEFWEPSARRIYQGKKTNIKDFPFIASIQIFNHFQCSGSIIKSDLIITAASCLQLAYNNRFFRENPAFLSARVGSTFHNGGGENVPILEVFFHPGYNPKSLMSNLCVLRLLRQLRFKKKERHLKKIDIDRNANNLPSITPGITIVGWGARQSGNVIRDPYLAFSVLDFYNLKDCQEVYSKQYVTEKNFCAGFLSRGGGACNRDVGSPGIVHGILTGVVSFGSPICGTPDAPTVFTKLGYYSEWIDSIMAQKVTMAKKRTTTLPPFVYAFATNAPPKPTFKIKPLVFPMKPPPLTDDNALRILKDPALMDDFMNYLVESNDTDFLVETANTTITKSQNKDSIEKFTFTYSPVTTLEPTKISSTQILKTLMDADDKTEVTPKAKRAKSISRKDSTHKKEKAKIKLSDKIVIEDKDKPLKTKLEQDIIKILDEINLEDFYVKEENETSAHQMIDNDQKGLLKEKDEGKPEKTNDSVGGNDEMKLFRAHDNNKPENTITILYLSDEDQKVVSDSLSSESSDSDENGLEIDDMSFKSAYSNNDTDDVTISNQELLQIVSEVLKEEYQNNIRNEKNENEELENNDEENIQ